MFLPYQPCAFLKLEDGSVVDVINERGFVDEVRNAVKPLFLGESCGVYSVFEEKRTSIEG